MQSFSKNIGRSLAFPSINHSSIPWISADQADLVHVTDSRCRSNGTGICDMIAFCMRDIRHDSHATLAKFVIEKLSPQHLKTV